MISLHYVFAPAAATSSSPFMSTVTQYSGMHTEAYRFPPSRRSVTIINYADHSAQSGEGIDTRLVIDATSHSSLHFSIGGNHR
ncbi:hypothetical protein V2G26_008218 [Clonostachys chloroleuca]